MKSSQVITISALLALSATSRAEISGSGHQIQGCSGVIQSRIWNDANRNGVQDAGETPLGGIALQLSRAGEPQLGTDTLVTDARGFVRFFNLCLTDHLLGVDPGTLPAGMTPTAVNIASEQRDVFDSDGEQGFDPVTIELSANHTNEETVDFGFARASCDGTIGDRVWLDEDANGLQDDYESGLADIALALVDASGAQVEQTTSDRRGRYLFAGLCAGAYTLDTPDLPHQFTVTPPSGAPGDANVLDILDADVGLFRAGCQSVVTGTLFADANADGLLSGGEHGLDDVAVYVDTHGYRQYALTDTNGSFRLGGLCAGSYPFAVDSATLPPDALTSLPLPQSIDVATDDAAMEMGSYGFITGCAGRIGDRVWLDEDGDGQQGVGELGIEAVSVLLRDHLGNERGVRTTDADGYYEFAQLCAGDYAVQVDASSLDASLSPTSTGIGSADLDSDGIAPVWLNLPSNAAHDLSLDFGYQASGCMLRLDTECHPLSLESVQFDCEKPVSTLSLIWRGDQSIRIVAYLGDENKPVLTEIDRVAPGERVEISGYDDAPNDVMWRLYDADTGAYLGESWFHLSCSDKEMDGPEDCGRAQGDGKDGDKCDDEGCINDWALDGVVDKISRLSCTSEDVKFNEQCTAQKDTMVYVRHELRNVGSTSAGAIAFDADHETSSSAGLELAAGGTVSFTGVESILASRTLTVSASGDDGGDGTTATCTADRSIAVSATPIPDCSVFGLSRLEKSDDKIKWRLKNAGMQDAIINRVEVMWPDGHGELKEIKRGGDKFIDQLVPPRYVDLDESSMHENRDKRRIEKDKDEDLEVKFNEKVEDLTDSDYGITVHFEQGCSVTLTP